MSSLAQILDMHATGGRKLADALFLELAGYDPDLDAQYAEEALDVAMRGMVEAVAEVNQKLGLTNPAENEAATDAAIASFRARWTRLCAGQFGGTA